VLLPPALRNAFASSRRAGWNSRWHRIDDEALRNPLDRPPKSQELCRSPSISAINTQFLCTDVRPIRICLFRQAAAPAMKLFFPLQGAVPGLVRIHDHCANTANRWTAHAAFACHCENIVDQHLVLPVNCSSRRGMSRPANSFGIRKTIITSAIFRVGKIDDSLTDRRPARTRSIALMNSRGRMRFSR